jgi:hypothetical protein
VVVGWWQGGLGEALSLMSEMEGRGIAADVVLLTTLLDACLKVHTAHCHHVELRRA